MLEINIAIGNNKEYKVKTIQNNIIYASKEKSYLASL